MATRHIKGCSTSLIVREMQIKTTIKHYLTSVRKAIIKETTNNRCWWECGEKGILCTIGGNGNYSNYSGKQYSDSSKRLKRELPYDPAISLLGIYPKKRETLFKKLHAPRCSQQHHLQWPRHGSNLSVHQQMMGKDVQHRHNGILISCKRE